VTVVARLRVSLRSDWRRTIVRCASVGLWLSLALAVIAPAILASTSPAHAQGYYFNPLPPRPTPPPARSKDDGQMLLSAQELNYDNVNSLVTAVGGVQISTTARRSRPTASPTIRRPSG